MIQKSYFPITIKLEVRNKDDSWGIKYEKSCKNYDALIEEMEYIKASYGLRGTDYNIYLEIQSKVNKLKI